MAAERRFTNHQRTSCHTLTTANHTSSRPFSVEVMVGILLVSLLSGRMDTSLDAVDLHAAVVRRICEALGRLILGARPDSELAMAVKADMLTAGGAVDLHAGVQLQREAKATYRASMWMNDNDVEEVTSPGPA